MASRFHRARQRRAERQPLTEAGNLNLVPLVDILTSIVFFSLLTYTGAALAALTAFDLTLPPVVVQGQQPQTGATPPRDTLEHLVAVRIRPEGLLVEHSGGGTFRQEIAGLGEASMQQLQQLMTEIRAEYPQNQDVTVVPNDEVLYDNVIQVMSRLRAAQYRNISLANRARAETSATPARPTGGD